MISPKTSEKVETEHLICDSPQNSLGTKVACETLIANNSLKANFTEKDVVCDISKSEKNQNSLQEVNKASDVDNLKDNALNKTLKPKTKIMDSEPAICNEKSVLEEKKILAANRRLRNRTIAFFVNKKEIKYNESFEQNHKVFTHTNSTDNKIQEDKKIFMDAEIKNGEAVTRKVVIYEAGRDDTKKIASKKEEPDSNEVNKNLIVKDYNDQDDRKQNEIKQCEFEKDANKKDKIIHSKAELNITRNKNMKRRLRNRTVVITKEELEPINKIEGVTVQYKPRGKFRATGEI